MAEAFGKLEIAEMFDIPESFLEGCKEAHGEIRGYLDFRHDWSSIEFIAVHAERPVEDQLYVNALVFGMPKPEPWYWTNETLDDLLPTFISGWSGERCVAVSLVPDPWPLPPGGNFCVIFSRGGNSRWLPVPIPARLQNR